MRFCWMIHALKSGYRLQITRKMHSADMIILWICTAILNDNGNVFLWKDVVY